MTLFGCLGGFQAALSIAMSKQERCFRASLDKEFKRRSKPHIRGPFVGGLYSCYIPSKPGLSATGLTPEMAYNSWMSYQGVKE